MEKRCPKCNAEMFEQDVLLGKTTQINEDEVWGVDWACDACGHQKECEY